ncbi:Uncharacterized membrane protein [Tessaracoccus bendigoensis DSM 12906]|uniref:Uncharacterized membrane protein n=1 Tax=Tessaracoccus bendigoensis DSM 12906 TaxID=1123357 RepID=A0A1M6LZL1_9ACTN|nr:glycosyltransferase 87 family protein [Tessaracoccus bendigoensis]SHJ76631.1 Uncharacterized membrane protein [Tessaracoccus bendigoensis DSM 12906]
MDNALHPRIGGPAGRHTLRAGFWFNPLVTVVLATLAIFIPLFLRHVPCLQTEATNAINSYIRVCYSDIQTTFVSQGLGQGTSPLGTDQLLFAPLIAVIILLTRKVASGIFDAPITRSADLQAQLDSSIVFFALTAVGLYVCFLVASLAMTRLGRGAAKGRASWDGVLLAASPIVFAAGLISWDLVPIALMLLGLAQFARGRLLEAGIVVGIAACAGTMPIAVALAVVLACGLRSGWRAATKFGAATVVTFFLVHLPLLLDNFDRVYAFYHQEINKQVGYGSLWYLASLLGLDIREAGSLGFALLMIFLGVFIAWLYVTKKRPRVGSLIAVIVFATAVLGPAYPPQTALWLIVALILSRPYRRELIALTVTEVGYYLAIWGWLGGALTTNQSGPYLLYWLAILLRSGVQLWILVGSIRDIATPSRDLLRTPDVPDPIGGALNDSERLAPLGEPMTAGSVTR